MRRAATSVLVLLLCFCLNSVLQAQSTNASVTGYVTDSTKSAIVGAKVIAINVGTNVRHETTTDNTGSYSVVNLPPGTYRLEVEKEGFKSVVKSDILLHVQDVIATNFEMALGSTSEVVTVIGSAPLVNSQSGSVSTVVDQTYVANMPLNGRSFQDLILLTPGTVTQTPQVGPTFSVVGRTGEFSVNGQRTESNYYTVDGVSANLGIGGGQGVTQSSGLSGSVGALTALGTTQALVSVDALQEFRVQSSSYSAEYGRNPGGQFAFETKSGTNQWRGTAYDYLRNGTFDTQDWFNHYLGVTQPTIRQNDFGVALGGPVTIRPLYDGKDRTFFFLSYEGLRLTAPQPANVNYVPDAALRSSAPAALQPALNAFPVANGPDDPTTGIAQYIGAWSNPSTLNSGSLRLDHVLNDKVNVFFRFSDTASKSATRGTAALALTPSVLRTLAYRIQTYTAGVGTVFSSRLINELRLNYSANETTFRSAVQPFGGSTPVDLALLTGAGPGFEPIVYLLYGGASAQLLQGGTSMAQKQWNFVDSVSLSLKRQQLKFGVDYRRLTPFGTFDSLLPYYLLSKSAVQTNSPSVQPLIFASAYPLYQNFSAFAQDEWRVTPRLNVSLGLRWEVNPAPTVTRGLRPYAIQGADPNTWALAPQGTPLWRTTWNNFAPRLGVAYELRTTPGREAVVRGGGGVFFDTGQQLGSLGFNGPGLFAIGAFVPGSFPALPAIPALVNPPVAPYNGTPNVFDPHLQLPYALEWNASFEQALGRWQALTVSYIGSHGERLLEESRVSAPNNPNAKMFIFVENGLSSDYNALQLQFRRQLSHGLTTLASYTWSHCLDYGSQNFVLGYQRGDCDFDIRHNFSAAVSYNLPNIGKSAFANVVLNHWGLDVRFTARTAFPVTLNGPILVDAATGRQYFAGLNLVPGQPVYLYGANCASVLQGLGKLTPGRECPGGRAINPQAFTNASSGLGTAPRNFTRGFGASQMDLALRRDFPINEKLTLQFRAEAFNIFNHANLGTVGTTLSQPTFGQATATLGASPGLQSSSLYRTGGPRSMQFAAKLIF